VNRLRPLKPSAAIVTAATAPVLVPLPAFKHDIAMCGRWRENCDPFTGDNVRHKFTWQGRDAIPGAGTFRRVVFHLKKAEMFSFRFAESDAQPGKKSRGAVDLF
jgi:hypothetical protein